MIDYQKLKNHRRTDTYTWSDREIMLYALGVGVGRDPMNLNELPFVYEGTGPSAKGPRPLPTFPTVLPSSHDMDGFGLTFTHLLHGELHLVVHKPLGPEGTVNVVSSTIEVYDKGPGRGALLCSQSQATFAGTNDLAYTMVSHVFATADGGFGGPSGGPARQRVPDRAPDRVIRYQTTPGQALLYRLNGDRNPLHCDPEQAAVAKFPRPILHGLCSYGISGWVIVRDFCAYDPARVATLDVRFTSRVFPGEALEFDFWKDGNTLSFRARVAERGVTALDDGRCTLR